ncbi:MAG TPA: hypothetical protein VF535_10055 [Allosphingosinicella sp.]|jgi:hypothetical protein
MTPDLSEFSYGFALTNEFVASLQHLNAAPVFPSLIEEGRAGGGYDVKLDAPGLALYIQFKRADCMVRGTASECTSLGLVPPFYRMYITERRRSKQHDLLLSLDRHPNVVFYAAPRFHTVQELNDAFSAGAVRPRSFFIKPSAIGPLDHLKHHVTFTESAHYVCSEPRRVDAVPGAELESHLREALSRQTKTLREGGLSEMVEAVRAAVAEPVGPRWTSAEQETYLQAVEDRRPLRELTEQMIDGALEPPEQTVVNRIAGRPKEAEEGQLRALADTAMKIFSAQLFVVQEK